MSELSELNAGWMAFHDKMKYRLVLHLCYFFIVLMSLVAIVNLANKHFNAAPNILAVIMCITSVFILRKTRNYRLVGVICSLCSFGIISGAFIFLKATHYLTPMWMIVNIMFTFFILGKKWGIPILIVHFLVLFYYLLTRHESNIVGLVEFTVNDVTTFIMEFSIVALAIGYILNLFIVTSKFSEAALSGYSEKLINQNAVISKQNIEMEVMLKEIHHRVKNNLQIISSLLRLQSETRKVQDKEAFQEAINRVSAMAIIHERIYKTEMLSSFDLNEYVNSLVHSLFANYSVRENITSNLAISNVEVSSDNIVPIAMLLNELVTNSIKHAFVEQEKPEIKIVIAPLTESYFLLEYADNGTWVENLYDSFGTEIIEAMTVQLEGTVTQRKTESGTFYLFKLKNA